MNEINELLLFTDGSVNTKLNYGYGAFLAIFNPEISDFELMQSVKVKRFEQTSSTKLELQTLLWALSEVHDFKGKITLYTDSQNILGLPGRRELLEKNNYYSKQNRRITNWELYQAFYKLTDELNIETQKVRGHKSKSVKDNIDRLFTIVDRASRNALRGENTAKNKPVCSISKLGK